MEPLLSPPCCIVFAGDRSWRLGSAGLEFGEDFGEEGRLCVDPEHAPAEGVDYEEAAVPEAVLGLLDEEGLEGVGDLVAHVGVGQVEAGEDDRLQLRLRLHVLPAHQLPHQHVDEHHVRRVDESHVLKHNRNQYFGSQMSVTLLLQEHINFVIFEIYFLQMLCNKKMCSQSLGRSR